MSYCPDWEDVQETIKSEAYKHSWRVNFLAMDHDDLIQESWIKFNDIVTSEKYKFENKWHFVGFFKTSFSNKVTDIIKYKKIENDSINSFALETKEGDDLSENIFVSKESSDFEMKLKEAPSYVKAVIQILKCKNDKINLKRITNNKLCGMLGYNSNNIDLIQEVKKYFKKEND